MHRNFGVSSVLTCATLALFGAAALSCAGSEDVKQTSTTSGDPPAGDPIVYVAKGGNDNRSGLSPEEAVATIATAMMRSKDCPDKPCPIWIAEGKYTEAVTLENRVDLFGGYSQDFAERDVVAHEVVLTSTEPIAVLAKELTLPTTVDGVTIRGGSFDAVEDGQSTYAVWMDHATGVVLSNVQIVAGVAANGTRGADGSITVCDAKGGQGGTAFDCGGSAGGDGTADGDPTAAGLGGIGGDSNCPSACPLTGSDGISDGAPGEDGGIGAAGLAGKVAEDADGSFDATGWTGAAGTAGDRGKHGTSGGGGGSGGSKKFVACFGCGTLLGGKGGDGGDAGCAGAGGTQGAPGGASFGLVLIESTVTLQDTTITSGRGGRGGAGGDGGIGGLGSDPPSAGGDPGGQQCGLINYASGGGALGGKGGDGGRGGGGAGGIGGAAAGVALVGASTLTEVGDVTVTLGEGGPGGMGGLGGAAAQQGFDGAGKDRIQY